MRLRIALCLRVCKNLQQTCAWWLGIQQGATSFWDNLAQCSRLVFPIEALFVSALGREHQLPAYPKPHGSIAYDQRRLRGEGVRPCGGGNAQAVHRALWVGESTHVLRDRPDFNAFHMAFKLISKQLFPLVFDKGERKLALNVQVRSGRVFPQQHGQNGGSLQIREVEGEPATVSGPLQLPERRMSRETA
eukprot:508045-Amphidinium_carterae.4